MVSMVIVLFLVAVAISLFFGRIAEVLTRRLNERTRRIDVPERMGAHEPLTTVVRVDSSKAA
jgi:hypothetical protein